MLTIQIILHVLIIAAGVNIAQKSSHVNVVELSLWILGTFAIGIGTAIVLLSKVIGVDYNSFILQLSSVAIMYSLLFFIFKVRFHLNEVNVRLKILGAHFIFVLIINLTGLF